MAVKTSVNATTADIKKAITTQGVRNNILKVYIIGYVASGEVEPFEKDEVYYSVSVSTLDHDFDIELYDTTSLAKARQRATQLSNSLHGYRGNSVKLKEYDENSGLYEG